MKRVIEIFTLFLPLLLSILFVHNEAYISGTIVVTIMIFMIVIFNPQCKERENLWMFILVTISLVPFNVRMANVSSDFCLDVYEINNRLSKVVVFTTVYSIGFAVQQIFCASITRLMFRRQKKML